MISIAAWCWYIDVQIGQIHSMVLKINNQIFSLIKIVTKWNTLTSQWLDNSGCLTSKYVLHLFCLISMIIDLSIHPKFLMFYRVYVLLKQAKKYFH
jgi:hypothetical protein